MYFFRCSCSIFVRDFFISSPTRADVAKPYRYSPLYELTFVRKRGNPPVISPSKWSICVLARVVSHRCQTPHVFPFVVFLRPFSSFQNCCGITFLYDGSMGQCDNADVKKTLPATKLHPNKYSRETRNKQHFILPSRLILSFALFFSRCSCHIATEVIMMLRRSCFLWLISLLKWCLWRSINSSVKAFAFLSDQLRL